MFLTSIGQTNKTGSTETTEFTKKLLEKAGIMVDQDKVEDKARSISPDIIASTPPPEEAVAAPKGKSEWD